MFVQKVRKRSFELLRNGTDWLRKIDPAWRKSICCWLFLLSSKPARTPGCCLRRRWWKSVKLGRPRALRTGHGQGDRLFQNHSPPCSWAALARPEQCEHFCFLKFKRSEMNVNRQHFPAFELEQNTVWCYRNTLFWSNRPRFGQRLGCRMFPRSFQTLRQKDFPALSFVPVELGD